MTPRQTYALANPCALPEDTLATEFMRALHVGSVSLSTILTVNK